MFWLLIMWRFASSCLLINYFSFLDFEISSLKQGCQLPNQTARQVNKTIWGTLTFTSTFILHTSISIILVTGLQKRRWNTQTCAYSVLFYAVDGVGSKKYVYHQKLVDFTLSSDLRYKLTLVKELGECRWHWITVLWLKQSNYCYLRQKVPCSGILFYQVGGFSSCHRNTNPVAASTAQANIIRNSR